MEKKKIVGCIIFLFILMISLLNSHVYAEPMSPSLYFGITELRASGMGYSIGDPDANGTTGEAAKIWNIVQYSGPSASNYTETNVYCVKAGYGFTTGAGTDEIQEYDVKFDMYTDRTSIAAQNDVLNGLVNGGHYNELLALLNIIYIPGESTEAEKDQLLTNAGIYQEQYPELFRLTDDEIEAVQQAAIWYFTNYGEENGKYDKYNNTAWLWYTDDGRDYSNLSGYNPTNVDPNSGAGRARQEQAELLYKYLIDTAKANANQYADGSTDHKHKITLYASTENAMAQPLVEVEKNPEEFDLALRKYITEVNGTPVDTRTPNIDESTLENGTTATYKHRKDPVSVRLGDTITYNITIYNEGDLDGRATQIIDQLPTGLRYAGINTQGYTAQYDETTNRVTITKQTTENLAGYDGQGLDSETIEIECTVETNEGDQILTNLAWIAEEVDENGTVITNQVGADRDSEPSTITVPTKDELVTTDIGYIGNSSNTGKDLADSNNYFEGQQDDDDFEKVIIEEITGSYQVQLVKVDENGNVITAEAGFRWTLPGQSEQTGTTSNGRLNLGTVQITDPSTTDTIQITETSAPAGYNPLVGSLTVEVTKGESNGNYVITGAQITAGGVEGTEVSLNGNVITIKVPNQPVEGTYQVQLEKVDENGNLITAEAGFSWTLPGQSEQTGTTSNGRLNLGTVQITDPNTTDTIQITETSAPAGYSPLVGSLTVQVTKGESNGNYVATGAQITAGGVEGAEVSLNGNVITITVPNKSQEFDLSLRKFISEVDGTEYDRAPDVDLSGLESGTTAIYNHPKDPITVEKDSVIIYTIRVYNEGEVDGYAEEITDFLPEELEFLPDHEINLQYEWQVSSDGRTVTTDYLSSAKETDERQNLIHAFDGTTLDYKDVQIACQVREEAEPNVRLTNLAEITEDKNEYDIPDRDSTPDNVEVPSDEELPGYKDDEINQDYVPGQEDDDDFEKVVISQEFDLALRKFITKVDEEDVTTRIPEVSYDREQNQITYNHTKDPVQVATGNVVEYTIRVYNEGNMAGYAQEITDDIPEGLRFLPENATNTEYRWVMYDEEGNVTENAEEAVEIRTDYLSKEQGEERLNGEETIPGETVENPNLLQAFNPDKAIGEGNPDYRDVKVAFEVIEPNTSDRTIINAAQISEDSDENGNPVEDIDSIPDEWNEGEDDQDREYIKLTYFDLALRKFITKVDEEDVTTRIPEISYDRDQNQITYNHTKDPVEVVTGNVVEYTIRIYNEGDMAGYAEEVADGIPDGLRFLPENTTNTEYRWVMYDEEGNVTENVEEAVEIRTDYLSKEQGEERLNGEGTTGEGTAENPNLLQAFNPDKAIGEGNPDYRDIKVAFEVVEPNTSDRIIVNSAQITEDSDENGNPVEDIDSIPDEWNEGEDDQDREYIKLTYFDLALRKWVTEAIVIENGKETVTQTGHTAEMDPEPVVKVELYRKNINDVTVKFRYSIRITNEGDIAGYAKEITDYVPEGLRFLAEDNPGWTDEGNNVISTRLLENTLLQPGESAEVEVVLTWINGEDNMGQMTNIAEISEDYNDKGVPDRDSTPDNKKPGEDDIDDAPVLLSVETGQERIYFVLGFTVLGTLAGGLVLIKKFVI